MFVLFDIANKDLNIVKGSSGQSLNLYHANKPDINLEKVNS